MKTKIFTVTLLSSAVVLTACGGTDENSDGWISRENINWSNANDLDAVATPIANLIYSPNNIVIQAGSFADKIHYNITNPLNERIQVSCETGSFKQNTDGSVTLDQCKSFKYTNQQGTFYILKDAIINGTINQKHISNNTSQNKSTVILDNLSYEFSHMILKLDGEITGTYSTSGSSNSVRQEITQLNYQLTAKNNNNNIQKYTLKNYSMLVNYLSNTVIETNSGVLSGEFDRKKFAVNFTTTTPFSYSTTNNYNQRIAHSGRLDIAETSNNKNTISITTTTTPTRLLYSAFSNNLSVSGFPRTIDWNDLD